MQRPFKFLDSYTQEDVALFHGRDKEIDELYSRIFESKLLLVYGVSGSGKSSLVNCGLASRFQTTDRLPVNVRRKTNINSDMVQAVTAKAVTALDGKTSLRKALRSVYLDHFIPVHLVVDQLEELFIFGDQEEQETFFTDLAKLLASDLNVKVVLIIREEFLAQLTTFEHLLPELFDNRSRLEKMTWRNAVQAIQGPCDAVGITLEEGFPQRLLQNIAAGRKEVELTYLQVYLDRVYGLMERSGERAFKLEQLREIGPIGDVLGHFLDEQIATFPVPEEAMTVLKAFVSIRGTKKQITRDEVSGFARELGSPVTERSVDDILFRAVNLRILKDQDEQGRYELRHDALAATIFSKITGFEKDLLEIRQFMDQAWTSYERRGVLLSEQDLKYIAPFEDRLLLNADQRGLVDQSKKEIGRSARRRLLTFGSIAAMVIVSLSVLSIWALDQKYFAERSRAEADTQRNIALQAYEEAERSRILAEKRRQRADSLGQEFKRLYHELDEAYRTGDIQKQELIRSQQNLLRTVVEKEQTAIELKATTDTLSRAFQQLTVVQQKQLATQLAQSSQNQGDPVLKGLLAAQAYHLDGSSGGGQKGDDLVLALRAAQYDLETKSAGLTPYVNISKTPRSMVATGDGILRLLGNDAVVKTVDMKNMRSNTLRDLSKEKQAGDQWSLSKDGSVMIALRRDGVVDTYSVADGTLQARSGKSDHEAQITHALLSPDNTILFTGDQNGRVVIWKQDRMKWAPWKSIETGGLMKEMLSSKNTIFIANGTNKLIAIEMDGSEREVALRNGDKARKLVAGKGTTVFVGTESGDVLEVNSRVRLLANASKRVELLAFDPHTGRIATVNAGRELYIFNENGDHIRYKLPELPGTILFGREDEIYLGFSDKVERTFATTRAFKERICEIVGRDMTRDEWRPFNDRTEPPPTCTGF